MSRKSIEMLAAEIRLDDQAVSFDDVVGCLLIAADELELGVVGTDPLPDGAEAKLLAWLKEV